MKAKTRKLIPNSGIKSSVDFANLLQRQSKIYNEFTKGVYWKHTSIMCQLSSETNIHTPQYTNKTLLRWLHFTNEFRVREMLRRKVSVGNTKVLWQAYEMPSITWKSVRSSWYDLNPKRNHLCCSINIQHFSFAHIVFQLWIMHTISLILQTSEYTDLYCFPYRTVGVFERLSLHSWACGPSWQAVADRIVWSNVNFESQFWFSFSQSFE